MKIAFVISSLSNGGAEKIISLLANYFVQCNEVSLILLCKKEIVYDIDNNINLVELNSCKNSVNIIDGIKNNINRYKELKNQIIEIKPDLIISFLTQTNILSILVAKSLHIPIIASERSIYASQKSKIWQGLRKYIYKKANYIVTQTLADLKNYTFLDTIQNIYNPLLINNKNNNLIKNREDIVLAVGRLHNVKQFDVLIKVFSQIETEYKLVILGEGNKRNNLEKIIKEKNLEKKVFLKGQVKNVNEYYQKSKIFVLSSKYEGFPNALLEAMSNGCACISFDCPYGPNEIITNKKDGILVKNQDQDELKRAIESLIRDESYQQKLSINAIENSKRFDYKNIMQEWENLIDEVVEGNKCVG